jgi:hypothetical protein
MINEELPDSPYFTLRNMVLFPGNTYYCYAINPFLMMTPMQVKKILVLLLKKMSQR